MTIPALPDVWGPPFAVAFSVSGFLVFVCPLTVPPQARGTGQSVTPARVVKRLNDSVIPQTPAAISIHGKTVKTTTY